MSDRYAVREHVSWRGRMEGWEIYDTRDDSYVADDVMEPEDAIFVRDLDWVVKLTNDLAAEADEAAKERDTIKAAAVALLDFYGRRKYLSALRVAQLQSKHIKDLADACGRPDLRWGGE